MDTDHDWHLFDVERGYEVRRVGDTYEVRQVDAPDAVTPLTADEFEQLRSEGDNPKGL